MALSGNFSVGVGSHWDLRVEWTAKQDVGGNSSEVTARLYWMGSYAVYSGMSNPCGIKINGGSFSTKNVSPALSGGQKKLLHTYTKDVSHDSDGGKDFTIEAYFDMKVTLDGSYYSSKSLSKSFSLNTIPRESTLNDTTPDWTAGSDITLSFKRYSSSFRHEIEIYLEDSGSSTTAPDGRKYTHLKQVAYTTSQTSKSTSFTTAEKYETFQRLKGGSSVRAWVRLQTYNGSTHIGTKEYYGTVTAPKASTAIQNDFTLGGVREIAISRSDSEFKHEVKVSIGSWSKTLATDATTNVTWNTATDMNSIMGQIASDKKTGNMTLTTTTYYYNGSNRQIVRSAYTDPFTVTIPNSQSPTFTGAVTWTDSNATLRTLKGSGNEAVIIQGASTLVVTLPSSALGTAKTGTTMKNYSVTIGNSTKSVNHPTTATNLTFTFNPADLNFSTNQTMKVIAYDKRGLSTTVNKTVVFVPYRQPSMNMKAIRNDGFGNISTVGLNGAISPITIGGSNKNSVVSVKYRYKEKNASDSSYTSLANMTLTTATYPAYKVLDVATLDLNNEKAWTVEFQVQDKIGTHTATIGINVGRPIFYIDPDLSSLGFNTIPDEANTFKFGGKIILPQSKYASAGGALHAMNSDFLGLNGLYFNDTSDGGGEGVNFLKSGKPTASTIWQDYDNFYVKDGIAYINDKLLYAEDSDNTIVWNGVSYPENGVTITPTKKLSECPNGWMLAWSDYDYGTGSNNFNWVYTPIPKGYTKKHGEGFNTLFLIPTAESVNPNIVAKCIYVHDDKLTGHALNNSSDGGMRDVVLRTIFAF